MTLRRSLALALLGAVSVVTTLAVGEVVYRVYRRALGRPLDNAACGELDQPCCPVVRPGVPPHS